MFFALGPVLAHLNIIYIMRRAGKFRDFRFSVLWKTLGLFSLIFFIALCSSFLEPFRCNVHPNGQKTLQSSHGVLCNFTGTHLNLCLIGCLVCLLPIGYLALSSWIILAELPKRVQVADVNFMRACSFLVMRFHPGQDVVDLGKRLFSPKQTFQVEGRRHFVHGIFTKKDSLGSVLYIS